MTGKQKGDAYMRIITVLVEILLGVVIIGGLGFALRQGSELHGRVCKLEERLPADFAQRVSNLEGRIPGLEQNVYRLQERVLNMGNTVPNVINDRILRLEESNRQLANRISMLEANRAVPRPPPTPVATPSERVIALPPASGRIVSPSSEDEVSTIFNYEIELRNPDATRYYYIVNRIGGLYWPKVRINLRSGVTTYTGTDNEGGNPPNGRFSIVLF